MNEQDENLLSCITCPSKEAKTPLVIPVSMDLYTRIYDRTNLLCRCTDPKLMEEGIPNVAVFVIPEGYEDQFVNRWGRAYL